MADTVADGLTMTLSEPAVHAESSPKRLTKQKKLASRLPRLHVRARDAAEIVGVSLATFWRLDSSGAVPQAMKLLGCKVWSLRSLRLWSRWGCPNRREFVERLTAFEADMDRRDARKGGRGYGYWQQNETNPESARLGKVARRSSRSVTSDPHFTKRRGEYG